MNCEAHPQHRVCSRLLIPNRCMNKIQFHWCWTFMASSVSHFPYANALRSMARLRGTP